MLIGLEGFGSIWSVRMRLNSEPVAFYNTTGLLIDGRLRHRSRIFGDVRFNEIGGFNWRQIERNIGRVFESGKLADAESPTLLLHHLLNPPSIPECFLFAVTSDRTGMLLVDDDGWKAGHAIPVTVYPTRHRNRGVASWVLTDSPVCTPNCRRSVFRLIQHQALKGALSMIRDSQSCRSGQG
jgi:hypothetical protein